MLFTDVLMCSKRARSCFSESVFGYGDSFAVLKRENNEKELLLSVLIQHFVQQPLSLFCAFSLCTGVGTGELKDSLKFIFEFAIIIIQLKMFTFGYFLN